MAEQLAQSGLFWILLVLALAAVFVLPTVIALLREVEGLGWVILANLVAVGWPAALLMACTLPSRPRQTIVPAPVFRPRDLARPFANWRV